MEEIAKKLEFDSPSPPPIMTINSLFNMSNNPLRTPKLSSIRCDDKESVESSQQSSNYGSPNLESLQESRESSDLCQIDLISSNQKNGSKSFISPQLVAPKIDKYDFITRRGSQPINKSQDVNLEDNVHSILSARSGSKNYLPNKALLFDSRSKSTFISKKNTDVKGYGSIPNISNHFKNINEEKPSDYIFQLFEECSKSWGVNIC